jgi:hypothetical protein
MTKKLILWLLMVLPVFFCSCEYELEETNFIELKKPEKNDFSVTLNAPQNEKGEYIIKYGYLKYEANVPNDGNDYTRSFCLVRKYDGGWSSSTVYTYGNYLLFDNYWYDNYYSYTLGYSISSPSNTGSLADMTGYEYLGDVFEWNLVFQPASSPQINLRYEKIDDKHYKLIWDTPDPDYGEVDYYKVVINSWYYNNSFSPIYDTSYLLTLPENDFYSDRYKIYVYAHFKESFLEALASESLIIQNPNYPY